MTRALWRSGAALVFMLLGAPAPRADETVPGRCLVVVDGKTLFKKPCLIGLQRGGAFTRKGVYGEGTYRVVPDKAAGTAQATWEADLAGTSRRYGPLSREGACWVDAHARLCAWSRAAEMRRNREAPYTAFRPLVGKIVQGYCHMNSCQWFRFEDAKLVDHNAHEALFEIRETQWEIDDKDRPPGKTDAATHDTYFARCSRTRPSFLTRDGHGGFDFAPGTEAGTYGASIYVYTKYAAACHALEHEITSVEGLELGYAAEGDEGPADTRQVVTPADALK